MRWVNSDDILVAVGVFGEEVHNLPVIEDDKSLFLVLQEIFDFIVYCEGLPHNCDQHV